VEEESDALGFLTLKQVELHEDKIFELTELFLINVDRQHPLAHNYYWRDAENGHHPRAPVTKATAKRFEVELADVHIELCPEEGLGAYAISYENVDRTERSRAPKLDLMQVATLRSAFIHRYEWVMEKLETVIHSRREAWEDYASVTKTHYEDSSSDGETENEVPLVEEEDRDAMLGLGNSCVSTFKLYTLNTQADYSFRTSSRTRISKKKTRSWRKNSWCLHSTECQLGVRHPSSAKMLLMANWAVSVATFYPPCRKTRSICRTTCGASVPLIPQRPATVTSVQSHLASGLDRCAQVRSCDFDVAIIFFLAW
jgi:hypothetical protein